MSKRKRFQARKFYGQEWSVVDMKANVTLGVAESRQAARGICNQLNKKLAERS